MEIRLTIDDFMEMEIDNATRIKIFNYMLGDESKYKLLMYCGELVMDQQQLDVTGISNHNIAKLRNVYQILNYP